MVTLLKYISLVIDKMKVDGQSHSYLPKPTFIIIQEFHSESIGGKINYNVKAHH